MTAPRIDFEIMLNSVLAILTTNLNSKLDSIVTEKGDSIALPHVDSTNGYAVLSLNDKIMNYDPFVAILCEDIQTEGRGPASVHQLSLAVVLVKSEDNNDPLFWKKMMRYNRAMSEVFEEHFSDQLTGGQMQIKNLAPKQITELNTYKEFRGTGVTLTLPVSS